MAGREREREGDFCSFLAEPFLFEPECTNIQNKRNTWHETLGQMCWIW